MGEEVNWLPASQPFLIPVLPQATLLIPSLAWMFTLLIFILLIWYWPRRSVTLRWVSPSESPTG